jgi:amino acid transporter
MLPLQAVGRKILSAFPTFWYFLQQNSSIPTSSAGRLSFFSTFFSWLPFTQF